MININMSPCIDCKHFGGVKQPDGTEKTEFAFCKLAKNNNANELVYFRNKTLYCDKYEQEED